MKILTSLILVSIILSFSCGDNKSYDQNLKIDQKSISLSTMSDLFNYTLCFYDRFNQPELYIKLYSNKKGIVLETMNEYIKKGEVVSWDSRTIENLVQIKTHGGYSIFLNFQQRGNNLVPIADQYSVKFYLLNDDEIQNKTIRKILSLPFDSIRTNYKLKGGGAR